MLFHSILPVFAALTLLLLPSAYAHAGHNQESLGADTDWATRHMAEEHHIQNFDPLSFFTLHDYDGSGSWTSDEIRRTYGLDDESSKDVSSAKKDSVVTEVMQAWDTDGDGRISRDEWMQGWVEQGKRLKDFGTGPGHHGDDEYEYEIHHFEKFHDENTKEEDLTHPEDIAHFKKHDLEADEAERQEQLDKLPIIEQNIPQKFRRHS